MTTSELTNLYESDLPPATADAWAVVYMDVEDKLDELPESNYEGISPDTSNALKSFCQETDQSGRSNGGKEES